MSEKTSKDLGTKLDAASKELDAIKSNIEEAQTKLARQNAALLEIKRLSGQLAEKLDFVDAAKGDGARNPMLSNAFLHFHQAALIFCSGLIGAIFLGLPETVKMKEITFFIGKATEQPIDVLLQGMSPKDLYVHVLTYLAIAAVVSAATALFAQFFQKWIMKPDWLNWKQPVGWDRKICTGIAVIGSLGTIFMGLNAAAPFICDVMPVPDFLIISDRLCAAAG